MTVWTLNCPNCGTANPIGASEIVVECGKVNCACTCFNCRTYFEVMEEYWRWLGLDERPPDEPTLERTS